MSLNSGLTRINRERFAVVLDTTGDTIRTKQSFRDECNINKIMAKWHREGVVDHLAKGRPSYGDFDNAVDYHDAQNRVTSADQAFAALPAAVRKRMDNDPAELLDFLSDPENLEEARELGLTSQSSYPDPLPPKGTTPQGAAASEEAKPSHPSKAAEGTSE